jgi:hypothetical protein
LLMTHGAFACVTLVFSARAGVAARGEDTPPPKISTSPPWLNKRSLAISRRPATRRQSTRSISLRTCRVLSRKSAIPTAHS